ncbi:putative acetamidase regulatory protein [Phaeomoniella chlamydospora]|uniref:Putative acetamidase regulatory protein n=1 Tax=Phaeomoniella chlamydospora TaxID=158046 RepID=A0A0G2EGY1_PHACM|nr:putative acetamidase regulatory protein [Phaeomoniella chlamydospora]
MDEPGVGEDKTHLVDFIDQEETMWQRPIDTQARITYVGTDISNVNFLVRQQGAGSGVYHFPSNRIPRRYLAHEPDRRPVEAFELPDKSLVNELLRAYFEKVNPGFPVVDEDVFMSQYKSRDPNNPPSLLLLQAILLVGAHVSKSGLERETLKSMFFRRAKILFDTRFERSRDTIVQTALLMTWHSDGPEDIAANAWFCNLEDCDVRKLERADFEGCGPSPAIDYMIQVTELCIILSGALRKIFGPNVTSDGSKAALRTVDAALAGWTLLLPDHLRLRPTITLEFWPTVLHLVYNNALILLHRPRPRAASIDESVPHDADICSAAAAVIQSLFESLHTRDSVRYLWTSSINALFTAMIQLSVEIRISNPILAISALRKYDSTLHSLRQLSDCWPNAKSVLHFFENSTKLQRPDLNTFNNGASTQSISTPLFSGGNSISIPRYAPSGSQTGSPIETTTPHLHNTSLTPQAMTLDPDQSIPSTSSTAGTFPDWKMLFPSLTITNQQDTSSPADYGSFGSGGLGGGIPSFDFPNARGEWREIYWQTPGSFEEIQLWNG